MVSFQDTPLCFTVKSTCPDQSQFHKNKALTLIKGIYQAHLQALPSYQLISLKLHRAVKKIQFDK